MRFSSRSKMSMLITIVALVTIVAGFFAYTSFSNKTHVNASGTPFTGTLGTAKVAGTITFSKLSGTSTSTSQQRVVPFHARPKSSTSPASANTASHISSNTFKFNASGALRHNFDGINAIQNNAVNGFDLEPPDEGLAASQNYVLNIVNDAAALYKPNGVLVGGPVSVNNFFAEPASAFVFDPRAYYDKTTNTWFAAATEIASSNTESHIDLAVNATGSPYGVWSIYHIDTTASNDPGCPCFGDYPIFGIDKYNVYITTNEFSLSGPQFNGAQIYAIPLSQLETSQNITVAHFGGLSTAGVIAYHIQPAITYGNPAAEYFMASLDPNSTFDNRLSVWAMTKRNQIAKGVMPNLSVTVINSEAYGFPVNAQTPAGFNSALNAPTTGVIQSDFDAMQEVEYINGYLYGALNTSVTVPGDTATRDGLAWFKVWPSLSGPVIANSTKVAAQGYVAAAGLYLMYPHINVMANGNAAMVFTYGGPTTFLSAGYTFMPAGAKNFGPLNQAVAGAAPDNGFTGTAQFGGAARWGDYSAGEVAPDGSGFWFATQYIPNNGDQFSNWGNRIFEVQG